MIDQCCFSEFSHLEGVAFMPTSRQLVDTKLFEVIKGRIFSYLLSLQETMEFRQALGENINDFYQDAATCSEVSTYYRIHRTIGETILSRFVSRNEMTKL